MVYVYLLTAFSSQRARPPGCLGPCLSACMLHGDSLTKDGGLRQMATIFRVQMTLQVHPVSHSAPMDGRLARRLTTRRSSSAAWRDTVHRIMELTARTATATVAVHRSGNTTLPPRRYSSSIYSANLLPPAIHLIFS